MKRRNKNEVLLIRTENMITLDDYLKSETKEKKEEEEKEIIIDSNLIQKPISNDKRIINLFNKNKKEKKR
jgi:hypothetical protein